MNTTFKITAIALLLGTSASLFAQETKEEEQPVYQITETVNVKHTPVDNQGRSGTCWCFAGTGFVEAEILRMYGKEFNLSEMFTVRNAWTEKIKKFVNMHGNNTLSQGGEVCDVLYMIDKYGMIPDADYTGKVIGEERHTHGEMNDVVTSFARAIIKNGNGKLSPVWKNALPGIFDTYLGEVPETFTVDGKQYTPKTFAEAFPLNPDNYIEIASYTDHELNKPFMVEIPDNWTWTPAYNLSLDDLMAALDNALESGYTVGWAQDVSDKGFSRKAGIGIVPADPNATLWEEVVEEKTITDADHQKAIDNWETGDDHSMLIVGIATDQNGTKYYKVKNSWGTADMVYDGYWYCSESYVRLHTIFFTLHKDALSKAMKKQLGI